MAGARKKAPAGTNGRVISGRLMRTKRQNIQLELALEPEARGEARSTGDRGTEARIVPTPNARRRAQSGARTAPAQDHARWRARARTQDTRAKKGPAAWGRPGHRAVERARRGTGGHPEMERNETRRRDRYAGTEPQSFSGGMGNMTKHDTTAERATKRRSRRRRSPGSRHGSGSSLTRLVAGYLVGWRGYETPSALPRAGAGGRPGRQIWDVRCNATARRCMNPVVWEGWAVRAAEGSRAGARKKAPAGTDRRSASAVSRAQSGARTAPGKRALAGTGAHAGYARSERSHTAETAGPPHDKFGNCMNPVGWRSRGNAMANCTRKGRIRRKPPARLMTIHDIP